MLEDDDGDRSFDAARDHVVGHLVGLVRALRDRGVDVPADGSIAAARALAAVGLDDRAQARIAIRSALVSREADVAAFDALFPAFWRQLRGEEFHPLDPAPEMSAPGAAGGDLRTVTEHDPATADGSPGIDGDDAAALADGVALTGEASSTADAGEERTGSAYSPVGVREPVGTAVAGEDGSLGRAVEEFVDALADRPGRGWTRPGTGRIDARRALRRSVSGAAPVPLPRRDRDRDAARLVLLVDVSRSVLDAIDRGFLLRFAATLQEASPFTRTFLFDTSIREVTGAFEGSGEAADALERAEAEWGGGTRIGGSIARLREEYPGAIDRRTVAVVVSDGLEVGELDDLEAGMAWLSRRGAGVLWLNPLAGSPGYEPTCRGMARALPYVDGLFAFARPADLAEAARQLDRHGIGGPVGYRYDPRLDGSPEEQAIGASESNGQV